ncbi:MAG: type II secretion system protein, partial [Culicoidibacterales bacterium]
MFKTIKNQKGITLVELLAVMVIVGIIAAISIPAIGNLIENTRKDAFIATAQNVTEAARLVVAQNSEACDDA